MKKFRLTETDDFKEMNGFFSENELEISADDPVPTFAVKCWKLVNDDESPPMLIGGVALSKREGEFIIDGIAVDRDYRGHKLGKIMLDRAIEEVRALSGESIYLVARAPGFFRSQGFENVNGNHLGD